MKPQQLVRNIYLTKTCLTAALFLFISFNTFAQLPPQQWANTYGGSDVDIPFVIKFTADGGTVAAGYTTSKDQDVAPHPNRDYWDLWITKLDRCGNIQWEKSFGGTNYESARDVVQTADGGFVVAGETNSVDGDVVQGYGGTKDIWVLKLDATGNLLWQKRYGGTGLDIPNQIQIATDGGFLIAGSTSSNDGNVSGNHGTGGYTDGLLLKLDASGNLQWSKCFGGSKNEELLNIQIINGKTYIAGYANSTDGDIPPQQKNYDVWLLALDQNGNKMFSKVYGGSQNDVAYSMTLGNDGTLTLAGYTTSTDGMVSGAKGGQDYWIINVSQNGNLNWQKDIGGSDAEYANCIITDTDGGYLVGGVSYSSDGDVSNAQGNGDFWLVKLSATGNIVWKRNFGGGDNDQLRFIIHKTNPEEYYLAGDSEGGGDFAGKGETDFAIIKFRALDVRSKDSVVCTLNGFVSPTDTLKDACGNDSVIVTYKPVTISGPFTNMKTSDTIFVGESITLSSNGNGTVIWDPSPSLSCTSCAHPVATPGVTTTYTAINSLGAGCDKTGEFTVVVLKDAVVFVPSAFTPNGDGMNDYFGPIGKVPDGYKLQVYNRNGEVVFQSSAIESKWNGTYKGQMQPNAVFIYLLYYKDMQNVQHQKKGTVTLIR